MAKEVILMEDVRGLGDQGEVVRVADGYARNFLLPRNLAAPVTESTRRQLEKKRKEREEQLALAREGAEKLAASIQKVSCTIAVKAGEGGKMYGSVTAADISASLASQGVQLDKRQIELVEPIRELGVFEIPVKLHPEVVVALKVWVVEE